MPRSVVLVVVSMRDWLVETAVMALISGFEAGEEEWWAACGVVGRVVEVIGDGLRVSTASNLPCGWAAGLFIYSFWAH